MGGEYRLGEDEQVYNDFQSDAHRRVAGCFTMPMTVTRAQRILDDDPYAHLLGEGGVTQLGIATRAEVQTIVDELEQDGVLKNVGDLTEPEQLVDACDDPDVIDLHPEKAEILLGRATHHPSRHKLYLDPGDNYVLSQRGHAKLLGPIPNEPPPPFDPYAPESGGAGKGTGAIDAPPPPPPAPDEGTEESS